MTKSFWDFQYCSINDKLFHQTHSLSYPKFKNNNISFKYNPIGPLHFTGKCGATVGIGLQYYLNTKIVKLQLYGSVSFKPTVAIVIKP